MKLISDYEPENQAIAMRLLRLSGRPLIPGKLLCTTDPSKKLDYRRHYDTDIRVTFERVRQEMEARRA